MTTLLVQATIGTPNGLVHLQQPGSYKLHSEFRGRRQTTHRKQDVTNPYVDGTYTIHSVRENVTEDVAVWVYGFDSADLRTKVDTLLAAFDQVKYPMTFTVNGFTENWTCWTADTSIETTQPLQVAKMALVRATVPRLPEVT